MRNIAYIEDFETWRNEFSFSTEIPIRFSETDMFGHVNNVSPFIYFEQARIEFMTATGIFDGIVAQDNIPIVADLQCDYIAQMYFGDTLTIYVKANSVGNSSVDIHYLGVNQKDDICLTGRGRLVNVAAKTGKPVPLTEEQKNLILNH